MQSLVVYFVKLSLLLTVMYLFYYLFLQRLTYYTINRWYLLVYPVAAFAIPLIKFNHSWNQESIVASGITNWIPATDTSPLINNARLTAPGITPADGILLIITAGIVFMLVRFAILLRSFYRVKKMAIPTRVNGLKVFQVNKNITPFSFGGAIFINQHQHSTSELQEILRHEMVHVKQLHSVDIILGEIICLLNWFNPFAWLLKKAIHQNLEFIVDQKVLQHGVNKKKYQFLLLKVTGGDSYALAAPFNYSSLKKRIVMMNKSKSPKLELCKLFLLLPATLLMLMAFSSKAQQTNQDLSSNIKSLDIKNNKAVIRLKDGGKENYDLTVVSEKNAFEAKYGKVPVAPPKHVPFTAMKPTVVKAPGVKNISVTKENKATVYLKNGGKEDYDLNIAVQKSAFTNKYGNLPSPPSAPPAPPAPPARL